MRIVVVVIEAPLASGNAAGRWYEAMVRELAGRGHEVSVFAACSRGGDVEATRVAYEGSGIEVFPFVFPVRGGLLSKLASLRRPHSYMFSSEFRRAFEGRVGGGGCDVVHLEQLWSGWLAPKGVPSVVHVRYLFRVDVPKVDGGVVRRLRHARTLQAERALLRRAPRVTTLSEPLCAAINEVRTTSPASVVPYAFDVGRYEFLAESSPPGPVVGLIGSMDWEPSASAGRRLLRNLWPEIKRRVPSATLLIVGWRARSVFAEYLAMEDVKILENVPDARPYFRQMRVMLYPPNPSSGIKVKVVEALAMGLPVVTNQFGVEGLPCSDGAAIGLAEDPEGLVRRTVELLRDDDLWERRRHAGRAFVESACAPGRAVDVLESVYRALIDGARP